MISDDKVVLIYVLFAFVISPVILFFGVVKGIEWIVRQITWEKCTCRATIVDDKAEAVFSQSFRGISSYTVYILSFKLEDEEIIELALPYKKYKKHHIGDTGELTFQGNKFIKFI